MTEYDIQPVFPPHLSNLDWWNIWDMINLYIMSQLEFHISLINFYIADFTLSTFSTKVTIHNSMCLSSSYPHQHVNIYCISFDFTVSSLHQVTQIEIFDTVSPHPHQPTIDANQPLIMQKPKRSQPKLDHVCLDHNGWQICSSCISVYLHCI